MKKLLVKNSKIHGKGLYAGEDIKKGEHIAYVQGEYVKKEAKNSTEANNMYPYYGITKTKWLNPKNTIWKYFNHSCNPNTAIVGTRKVVALRNIGKNEEITFDYSMTDGDKYWQMKCGCNSNNCRKVIKCIQLIDEKTYRRHLPFIPKYFIKLREKSFKSVKINRWT